MDSFEIVTAVINGATLEIYTQESKHDQAAAYVDENPVSITQAARAAQNPLLKVIAKSGNWAAYASPNLPPNPTLAIIAVSVGI